MPKVLISDKMSPLAEKIFREQGVEVDVKTGLKPDELKAIIGQYDGLVIRSATQATAEILEAATKLKVVGRAGIGVDNVDIPEASKRGVIVMNTPFGNTITTAEHAIALMISAARMIPQATVSMKAGKWEKTAFEGVELYQKTLGVIGTGNIGALVCERAIGLKMRVIAYDPYISKARADDLGIELVDLDGLFAQADFITIHTPLTDSTRGLINAANIAKMKPNVILVNAARGGIVNEDDLYEALKSKRIRAAALDVFVKEPLGESKLLELDNFICSPHLGASTEEAQINVAVQIAEQISAFLLRGVVQNAVNIPAVAEADIPVLQPYINLGERLGMVLGQLAHSGLKRVMIEYAGEAAALNTKPVNTAILKGILQSVLPESINMVNAPFLAKERGIEIEQRSRELADGLRSRVRVQLIMDKGTLEVAGTLVHEHQPRLISINGMDLEMSLAGQMLYVANQDKPGLIGRLGTLLAQHNINIANFHLGRDHAGGQATAFIGMDTAVSEAVLKEVRALPNVLDVRMLSL